MTTELDPNNTPKDTEPSLSLGNYLQRERQKKNLSILEIAEATKVPAMALKALEEGNKKQLPVTVFTKGFVKIYGRYLGLNENDVLNRFQKEWATEIEHASPEMLREESMAKLSPFYLSLQFYLILIVILFFLGLAYFFFNANDSSSKEISLSKVREMQILPPSISTKQEHISIVQHLPDSEPAVQTLISPQSAGKIAKEEDSEDIILAELPSVILVQKKALLPLSPVTSDQSVQKSSTDQTVVPLPNTPLASTQSVGIEDVEFIEEILPEEIDENLPLDLHIAFLARTRISISQDEEQPAKYIFSTGEESSWKADKTISMQVEKSDNIRITLNGKRVTLPESQDSPLAITLPADLRKR